MRYDVRAMPEDAVAFTVYVRGLGSGDEPSPAVFEAAWNKLRRVLISELRKRALWSAPPSYLGIYGHGRWSESEALEELLLDCFEAVFVHRLTALEALLADEGREIDPLCVRNVRYFLHERQKRNDPLGFRVFGVVRGAIRRLLASATLEVLDGDPRVRNSTLLGFSSCAEPDAAGGIDLTEHVEGWLDDLLPELVTAQPARLPELEETLGRHLAGIVQAGVKAFRFKDVVGPLKSAVQAWRDAVWEVEAGVAVDDGDRECASIIRQVRPGTAYEERQFFDKLVECVSQALPRTVKTKKTGAQLLKYWNFLRCQVADDRAQELPSRRKIAELLDIQRYRIASR